MTGQAAAAGLQKTPPDTSGTCSLDTLELPALTCATVLAKLLDAVPITFGALAPYYGTGTAAPVFIQVTVAEALGFETNFTDPMSGTAGLSYAALLNMKDAEGVFREAQMGKKFQAEGTGYNVRMGGLAYDCRTDPDCKMSTPMPNSCTATDACNPTEMTGFHGLALPGRLWGESGGFDVLKKGTKQRLFKDGMIAHTVASDELEVEIKTGDHAGSMLKHFKHDLLGLYERNENCGGDLPGTPGFDCEGPKHAMTLAPLQSGAPMYFSQPFFDTTQQFANDPSQKTMQYGPKSYNPEDKVDIIRCKGHAWCTEKEYTTYLKYESASGFVFAFQFAAQMNLRIGSAQSMFFPKMADSTIPVWWAIERVSPPDKILGLFYTMQSAPAMLTGLITWLMIVGGVCVLLGLLFCGMIFYRQNKHQHSTVNEVEVKS